MMRDKVLLGKGSEVTKIALDWLVIWEDVRLCQLSLFQVMLGSYGKNELDRVRLV